MLIRAELQFHEGSLLAATESLEMIWAAVLPPGLSPASTGVDDSGRNPGVIASSFLNINGRRESKGKLGMGRSVNYSSGFGLGIQHLNYSSSGYGAALRHLNPKCRRIAVYALVHLPLLYRRTLRIGQVLDSPLLCDLSVFLSFALVNTAIRLCSVLQHIVVVFFGEGLLRLTFLVSNTDC